MFINQLLTMGLPAIDDSLMRLLTAMETFPKSAVLGSAISFAKMLGLLLALCMGSYECWMMMLGRRGMDVMKLARIIGLSLCITYSSYICESLKMPGKGLEDVTRQMAQSKNREVAALELKVAQKQDDYLKRLRQVQDSIETAKQVQEIGEDAHWWDKLIYNMENLGSTINNYAQRAAVAAETKVSEWINDVIRFVGELIFQMSYYGMLVAQRIFMTILATFAPIMFALSIVPPWSNAWAQWMGKYLSLSLWGFVVYFCLYYIDFILNQYLYIAAIVIFIALIVAMFLARRISLPIVKMKDEANKLAQGDYNAKFETNSFSEINDLASTLDDATDKLSKVNELRKDLVANVSHDIKTPLTMIKAYAEMIKDISGDDPKKRNEHLDVILQETEYLNKLVTDMSELSKLQSGVIEINRDNFDLKECVNKVVLLLSQAISEKNIKLILDLDDCFVYADEIKLSQVIYNFLSNALKYSDADSKITVRIRDSEDKVRLEVIDNGNGISEEALPYIWDRYYKVDKNFNRSVNSTGLGLAIAKAILEAHKAHYGVESKLGEGSTFWFELDKDYENEE